MVLLVLIPLLIQFTTPTPEPVPTEERDLVIDNRQQGRTMQALYQVEVEAARTGWTPILARTAGDLWREAGDMASAVSYWEISLSFQPDNAGLIRQIAQTYIDLQQWTQAYDMLQRFIQYASEKSWGYFQLGLLRAPFDPSVAVSYLQLAAQSSDFEVVANELLTVLQNNTLDSLMSMRVGFVFMDHELWSHAELAFSQAAVAGQVLPEALAYNGLARDRQGKDGSAWIEQAVSLAPDNAQVHYVQALHLRAIGDNPGSLDALLLTVSLVPGNPAYCAELATAYRLLDDLPNAMLWYQQAVILSNNAPEFQRQLALFYAEEATTLAFLGFDVEGQLSNLTPEDPDVLAELGWSLYNSGDTEGAQTRINAALTIDPQNPRALYYRARILINEGEQIAAVPLLQIVTQTDNEFSVEAQRILTSLGY
ncbi:MAG: hypothetical protein U0694_11860 [Anaerolineae bacterium]